MTTSHGSSARAIERIAFFPTIAQWLCWPALLAAAVLTTALAFARGYPVLGFNATYAGLVFALVWLERRMPHEPDWVQSDKQLALDLGHTLVSTGAIQTLVVVSGVIGLSHYLDRSSYSFWPQHWPLAIQVALGLAVSEFAAYWAHRLAHEWRPLWYFHAVHHGVERLWCGNSGRFHFIDALKSVLPGVAILVLAGAPGSVLAWLSALTGYIGLLTHCNVAMRFGPLSLVFNTPELHRWHHSMNLREGNKNYGENLAIWDLLFGTWFNEDRRPPRTIGVRDRLPAGLAAQLAWPFRKLAGRSR